MIQFRAKFSLDRIAAALLFLSFCLSFPALGRAQSGTKHSKHLLEGNAPVTAGKKKVEDAFAFQRRLLRGLETIDSVIKRWSATAKMAPVKKDSDALGIAYGSEGLMEIERDSLNRADSLLRRAVPLFLYRNSEAYFVVALAQLESKRNFYDRSVELYAMVLDQFDSLDALNDIDYYANSGYAVYAYGIDAALHIAAIGGSIPQLNQRAVGLLLAAAERHPYDEIGLMAYTGLKHIHKEKAEDYAFKIELICSTRSAMRKTAVKFEKQFSELK
ncbi:MAG: hypothetical protein ABI444_04795 [Candidatus Kapaibacterium sp.]|jgi:hypothetical protein